MKKKKNNKILNDLPIYHIVQQFLNAKNDKKESARTAASLKYSVSAASMSLAIDKLITSSAHYKELLWGKLFPTDASELGEGNSYFFKSESIIGDINWLYIQISKYREEISFYIQNRDLVEKDILLGYYDDALSRLESIRKKIGVSIWYYEMRMLIYSYTDKEAQILDLLTEINQKKRDSSRGFVPFLLSFLYKRCSKSHSAYAFDSELDNRFNYNRSNSLRDRHCYYLFRLNFYTFYHFEDLSPMLIMEATNSLVDRYNVLVNVLKASFANAKQEIIKSLYSNIATKFYKKLYDSNLSSMVAYGHLNSLDSSYYNEDFIALLDYYYSGNYSKCIEMCKEFTSSYIPLFDVVKIYCKCILLSGEKFQYMTNNNNAIINQIALLVYKLMSETENDEVISALYQICKNTNGLSIANGLIDFINKQKHSTRNKDLRFLSLNIFDPLYCGIYNDTDKKQSYIETYKQRLKKESPLVLQYQECRNKQTVYSSLSVASYIKDMDTAKIAYYSGDYENALNLWISIHEKYNSILPIIQTAIKFIYCCYEHLDKKQDAISFYVNNYLKGKAYVSHIDTKHMEEILYKEKYKKGVKKGLDLQIFVFLTAKEDERKGCVLERYCAYKDVTEVSDLIPVLRNEPDRKKVELYLYLLATEDILRHMVYVDSTKKMLEEQQKIASHLASIESSENLAKYKNLSQELADTMIVFQNIKKIDESKIFVNQNALLKYDLNEYEALYHQFKKQFSLSGPTNSYYIVNAVDSQPNEGSDNSVIRAQVKFTNKAFVDSSCQVFNVIREKFLFSKFGMKTYLSTRIRHGVLEGVLRSGLDSLHLVLLTEHNKYAHTPYWKNKYGLTQDEHSELMKVLEKFSKGINFEIDRFKEEVLQIKLNDNDKGLFDFRLSSDDMCYATVLAETKSQDYNEFCAYVIEYLLRITNANLVNVRREINKSLKANFNNLVNTMSQDITKFSSNTILYDELNRSVTDARTDVNQKMTQIEKWFYLQDAKFDNFSLIRQIDIVWNITHKMYPNIICNVDMPKKGNDVTIKSAYFIHISDILTIFFNNMLSYSKPNHVRKFSISLEKNEEGYIKICFINEIKEPEEILNAKFKEMLKSDSRLQEEGRSGLVKVRKILKYDLGCLQNEVEVKAEDGKCISEVIINLKDIIV